MQFVSAKQDFKIPGLRHACIVLQTCVEEHVGETSFSFPGAWFFRFSVAFSRSPLVHERGWIAEDNLSG